MYSRDVQYVQPMFSSYPDPLSEDNLNPAVNPVHLLEEGTALYIKFKTLMKYHSQTQSAKSCRLQKVGYNFVIADVSLRSLRN